MKPTEIEPLHKGGRLGKPGFDRLTQVLVWVAFFLVAAVAALITDLWLRPASNGPVVQAVGPTYSAQVLTPTPQILHSATPSPATPPTAEPSVTPVPPPTEQAETADPPSPEPTKATDPPTVEPTATAQATASMAVISTLTPPACVPPDDWGLHIVQPGNTLYSIARRYGTDVSTLMYVNCLNTHTIFVDQRIYVPGPVASPIISTPVDTLVPLPTSTRRAGASATPSMETQAAATPFPTPTPKPAFRLDMPSQYLNIVLLGSDKRPRSGAWRTDSMIVVSVDSQNNVVRLLSIPRDLWVYIPGHGYNRINTADLWGELAKKGTGPDRVKQTIHQNLGIPIHYYVRVDFQGFMEIIDTVGGIDVDVDCPLPDINLSAGMHHMNGQEALRYARSRKSTNDFDRGRRQRKVLMALWDQALTMDIIPKLPELWRTMGNTVQTDLPLRDIINLAYVGVNLRPQHILSRAIGPSHVQGWMTPQGASVLLPREDKIRTMLESFYTPVNSERLDAVDKVHIQVLNGSARQQAGQLAAANLRWDGFQVDVGGPADRQDYVQTKILVYNGDTVAAERIVAALRLSPSAIQDLTPVQEQPNPSDPVDIQIVLGSDYNPCQR